MIKTFTSLKATPQALHTEVPKLADVDRKVNYYGKLYYANEHPHYLREALNWNFLLIMINLPVIKVLKDFFSCNYLRLKFVIRRLMMIPIYSSNVIALVLLSAQILPE